MADNVLDNGQIIINKARFLFSWILYYEKDNRQVNNWISDKKGEYISVVEKRSVFIMAVKESYSEVTFEQRTEKMQEWNM